MSEAKREQAARANQRAAAFVRFQMSGDHEAMHLMLSEVQGADQQLAFITALANLSAMVCEAALGHERSLQYLESIANTSAMLIATGALGDGPAGDGTD